MANTTWSATDKLNCTTSGLTVGTVTGAGGARTVDFLNSGKRYFEYTCTTWTSNAGVGLANSKAILSSVASSVANATFVQGGTGSIWVNGTQIGSGLLGARANGDVIGVAVDLTNGLIWYRVAPAGNWNGAAGASPVTGQGGIFIGAISSFLSPVYGLFAVNNATAQSITANFGDSAFVGALPAGFIGGFAAGAALPPTELIATQVGLEHVYTLAGTVRMSVTQIALEHWVSAAGLIPEQMLVTQVSLEQWVINIPPPPPQARAMIIA